jgi:hypothetical protein
MIDFPEKLWKAAKIRAMDDRTTLRGVVIAALEAYLAAPKAPKAKVAATNLFKPLKPANVKRGTGNE